MSPSRRDVLWTLGAAAAATAVADLLRVPAFAAPPARAPALGLADLERLGAVALDRARKLGCSYADIRINRYRNRSVGMRTSPDRSAGAEARKFNHVPSATESESFGFGVRVLRNGVWGFAASPRVEKDEIARVTSEAVAIAKANAALARRPIELAPVPAYRDRYTTPFEKNPFDVPVAEQLAVLQRDPRDGPAGHGDRERLVVLDVPDRGQVLRLDRGIVDPAADPADLSGVQRDRGRRQDAQEQVALVPGRPGDGRLRARRGLRHAERRAARGRGGGRAPRCAVGRAGAQGPRALAVAPRADDPRVDRTFDRARSCAGLRGELRRHVVRRAAGEGHGQAPLRLAARQRRRRPTAAQGDVDRRLRRRWGQGHVAGTSSSSGVFHGVSDDRATRRTWWARARRAAAATPTASTASRSSACPTCGSSRGRTARASTT